MSPAAPTSSATASEPVPKLSARWVRSAAFWLSLQALVVLGWLAMGGHLESQLGPDSQGFRWKLESGDIHYFLATKRTFGYPVFLWLVERLTAGVEAVATLQLVTYLGSVVLFGAAAQRFFGSALLAVGAASPLFYFELLPWLTRQVASDLLGAALAIATAAALLWFWAADAAGKRLRAPAVALGVALFLCYQTRPSYLFLVPLLPLLGLVRAAWRERGWRSMTRGAVLTSTGLAVLPLLAWCTLRLILVGEFGVVSFGGMNVIGITAPMVTPEVVPHLPADLRLFARKLMRQRERFGLAPLEPEVDYRRWRNEFNQYAHFVSAEALLRTVGGKPGTKLAPWPWANRFYTRFSLAMIRQRPDLYGRWLWGASKETARWLLAERVMRTAALALLGALLFALARRWRSRSSAISSRTWELLALAVAWALAGQALVIAVEVPLARYNLCNFMLLPGALLALALDLNRSRSQTR